MQFVKDEKVRRHVCGQCGRITYLNPRVVAGMIPVTPNGDVVLLKRAIEPAVGKWTYPAGYQELGETVAEAAERETREEGQMRLKAKSLLGVYSYPHAGVVTVVYEGRLSKNEKPRAGHEVSEAAVFPPHKIPWKDLAFWSVADALRDWKKKQKKKK